MVVISILLIVFVYNEKGPQITQRKCSVVIYKPDSEYNDYKILSDTYSVDTVQRYFMFKLINLFFYEYTLILTLILATHSKNLDRGMFTAVFYHPFF